MKAPFSVYSTWGLHDELGDRVELSESLARGALDSIRKWKTEAGISTDFFHLDAFWFDPSKGYRFFKNPNWPRGFQPFLEDLLSEGLKPGLWFSTTGYRLDVPAWRESRCASGHYSLAEGPYADALEADLHHAAEKWAVRLFKFDFADFFAAPEGTRLTPAETYARAVQRFSNILLGLRAAYPDLHAIAHCGFARNIKHERSGWPAPAAVDPSLLGALDAVFSGDPNYADIPQTALHRNLDCYQDRAVWKLWQAGFPLHRIEDHGVLMARTNTACNRGRDGFRRSHIGQLARGAGRDLFYGDPSLLTAEDLRGMLAARTLFFDAFKRGLTTSFIGAGEPGLVPWHAYLTGGAGRGLLYLVNTSLATQRASLPLVNLSRARALFTDAGSYPAIQTSPDHLAVELQPEQMVLIGLGSYAEADNDLGADGEFAPPRDIRLLTGDFRPTADGVWTMQLPGSIPPGAQILVTAQAWDAPASDPAPVLPFVYARQNNRQGPSDTIVSHDLLQIRALTANGQPLAPRRLIPDAAMWSGVSGVGAIFPPAPGGRVEIHPRLEPPRRITAAAYLVFA